MMLHSLFSIPIFLLMIPNDGLTNAAAVRTRADVGCGFHILTGQGPIPLPVGQLDSGQCRAGNGMVPSLFTWFGDAFVDQQGRGC